MPIALNVTTYSISMTTLEEVFMALGHQAEQEAAASGQAHSENTDFRDVEAESEGVLTRPETSERRSAKAMMRLRLRLATANRSSIYSVLVLPIILNIACFASRGGSSQSASEGGMSDIMLVTYPPMAFGVSIIAFTLQLVREREVKCKHVALAQGLSVRAFWLGTLMDIRLMWSTPWCFCWRSNGGAARSSPEVASPCS
ncbi:unnamed protein product [Effrenium voratum]|nr:unnamed protein product [Effrenium voratum]